MTTSRVQLALNVTDLEEATRFYRDLFGVEPAKRRVGYANFAIADPPLKLVLFENPTATSALNHLGVEAASTDDVAAAAARFAAAGLATTMSRGALLPRPAGQGVGQRTRRPPRRLGVLHGARRRPRAVRLRRHCRVLHQRSGGARRRVLQDDMNPGTVIAQVGRVGRTRADTSRSLNTCREGNHDHPSD